MLKGSKKFSVCAHSKLESSNGEIIMYQPDETIRLEVRMDEETVWLSANYDQRNRILC